MPRSSEVTGPVSGSSGVANLLGHAVNSLLENASYVSERPSASPSVSPIGMTLSPTLAREQVDKAINVILVSNANGTHNSTDLEMAINTLLSQGYIFSPDPYEPSGWGEIWAVVVCSVAIFFIPGTVALIAHLKSLSENQPAAAVGNRALQTTKKIANMFVKVFVKFFNPLSRRDRDTDRLGVEGASILLFERELGRLLLIMAVITNVVLVPLHHSFGSGDGTSLIGEGHAVRRASNFIPWTIQNVPVNAAYGVLWVHVLFVYLLTWMTVRFSSRVVRSLEYIELRKSQRPSGIVDARQRKGAHREDEEAKHQDDAGEDDHHLRENASLFVEGQVNFFPSSEQDLYRAFELAVPGHVQHIRIFEQRTRLKKLGEFRSVVTFESPEYARDFLSARLRKGTIKRRFQELLRRAAAEKTRTMRKGEANASENTESEAEEGDEGDALLRARVDAALDQKDSAEFQDLSFLSALRMERWVVEPAPDPQDIMWDALAVDRWTFMVRSACVNLAIVVCLFAFTTPIAFISFISGVASPQVQSGLLATYVNVVANLRVLSPALGDFLFSFLPQLLLVICDAWLLFALQLTSKSIEPHYTHSGRETSLFRKSFFFLVFNTLLLPSLAFSNIGAFVGDLFQNEASPFALLGRAFATSSGAFTLTFIPTQTWVGASMDVTRLSERLFFMAKGYARPWASAEERKAARLPQFEFDYGTEYAMCLTLFSLCVVFATVVPPILFFGVSYFIVKQATDDHCLRHLITPQHIDHLPRAHVARSAVKYLIVSVALLQSSIFGFLSSEVCIPSLSIPVNNSTALHSTANSAFQGNGGAPCIANDHAGVLTMRGSFGQILSLVVCLVCTCVAGLRAVMKIRQAATALTPRRPSISSPAGLPQASAAGTIRVQSDQDDEAQLSKMDDGT